MVMQADIPVLERPRLRIPGFRATTKLKYHPISKGQKKRRRRGRRRGWRRKKKRKKKQVLKVWTHLLWLEAITLRPVSQTTELESSYRRHVSENNAQRIR